MVRDYKDKGKVCLKKILGTCKVADRCEGICLERYYPLGKEHQIKYAVNHDNCMVGFCIYNPQWIDIEDDKNEEGNDNTD